MVHQIGPIPYGNDNRFEEAGTLGFGWDTFRVGSNPSYGEYFQGSIDEVRIYDHALSDSEISQLYNQFLRRSTTAVPTMTEWGMIIFVLLAGLGSVYYLRKQRKA